MFIGKCVLKICSKYTGEHPRRGTKTLLKLTSVWVFSCKFTAYFQNNFLREHLWWDAFELRQDFQEIHQPRVSQRIIINLNKV